MIYQTNNYRNVFILYQFVITERVVHTLVDFYHSSLIKKINLLDAFLT